MTIMSFTVAASPSPLQPPPEIDGLLQRMAVLKGMSAGALPPPPIQVMALLEGYRHSLKRAERLLRGVGGDGGEGGKDSL